MTWMVPPCGEISSGRAEGLYQISRLACRRYNAPPALGRGPNHGRLLPVRRDSGPVTRLYGRLRKTVELPEHGQNLRSILHEGIFGNSRQGFRGDGCDFVRQWERPVRQSVGKPENILPVFFNIGKDFRRWIILSGEFKKGKTFQGNQTFQTHGGDPVENNGVVKNETIKVRLEQNG